MYPFLVKTNDKILKFKANNTPFMNFSETPIIENITLENWESLIVYSDGIVEDEADILNPYTPENLIKKPTLIEEARTILSKHQFEDDITVVYLSKQ